MIDEVDEALRRLLRSEGIGDAVLRFGPHCARDSVDEGAPVVELRLEDVTEDVAVRQPCWEDVHEGGRVRWRRPPMRWYRLAYGITTRADGAEAEHRLLAAVLRCLVVHEQMPARCLVGSLQELDAGVLLTVAAPRPERLTARRPWRPSLALVVTAPLQPAGIEEAPAAPQTSRLSVSRPGAATDTVSSAPGDVAMRRPATPTPPTEPVHRGSRPATSA